MPWGAGRWGAVDLVGMALGGVWPAETAGRCPEWSSDCRYHPGKMETVQVAITDAPYAAALRELLERSATREVHSVDVPDPSLEGVIVVDSQGLDRLPFPLLKPERVVLVTRNDPQDLSRAWNAGIRSVVFCDDPLNTAVLAIMAAELRLPKACSAVQAGAHEAKAREKRS